MPIVNLSLDAQSLSRMFSSQTIAIWCIDTCNKILGRFELPDNAEYDSVSSLRNIMAEIRSCIIELERYTGPITTRIIDLNLLCVTILNEIDPSDDHMPVVIRQFDLTAEGLKGLHPNDMLFFLIHLCYETIKALEHNFMEGVALPNGSGPYYNRIDALITQIAPIFGAVNSIDERGNLIIDLKGAIVIRLQYD